MNSEDRLLLNLSDEINRVINMLLDQTLAFTIHGKIRKVIQKS